MYDKVISVAPAASWATGPAGGLFSQRREIRFSDRDMHGGARVFFVAEAERKRLDRGSAGSVGHRQRLCQVLLEAAVGFRELAVEAHREVFGERAVVDAGFVLDNERRVSEDAVANDPELGILRQVRRGFQERRTLGHPVDPVVRAGQYPYPAIAQVQADVVDEDPPAALAQREARAVAGREIVRGAGERQQRE